MELLLPEGVERPLGGAGGERGLIVGTKVQNGKYLVTHLVPISSDDVETMIGYCEQVSTRLIGGCLLVGCHDASPSQPLVAALREFKESDSFAVVDFASDKPTAKTYQGNKLARGDIKLNVAANKFPTTLVKSKATVTLMIGTENLEYGNCHSKVQQKLEEVASRLRVTYDGALLAKGECVLKKNSKVDQINLEAYFAPAPAEWVSSKSMIRFSCCVALFGVITNKTTFGEVTEIMREDFLRSLTCRLAIIEEQMEEQDKENENVETLFTSAQLARRINYPLSDAVPVSLYQSSYQAASADLADFFGVAESSKLFDEVEEEIEDEEEEDQAPTAESNNKLIAALLVLILSILVAIFLQS